MKFLLTHKKVNNLFILTFLFFLLNIGLAAQDFDCMDCHENFTEKSIHNEIIACQDCHSDVADESHMEDGAKSVNCADCHEDYENMVQTDIHHRLKVKNAPTCKTCHGSHQILSPSAMKNPAKTMCGSCHESMVLASTYHRAAVSDSQCQDCHAEKDYPPLVKASVHSTLNCVDCHGSISNELDDHPANLDLTKVADCYVCHSDIAKEHEESIHGISILDGIEDAAKCWDCHGSHEIVKVSDPASPVYPSNLVYTCGYCHDDPNFQKKHKMTISSPGVMYSNSVHGKSLGSGSKDAPTCLSCHGTHNIKNRVHPESTISSFNLPKTCGQCHEKETEEYTESIHWFYALKGIREAPVCNDCHNEHSIKHLDVTKSKANGKLLQEQTCMICHQDPRLAERFGKNGGQSVQYQDSYHGLAAMRGYEKSALCVDCHAVHKILPKSYPESTVSEANVTKTCQTCHPDATEVFSKSYSHVSQSEEAAFIENLVSNLYFWLVVLVIGGMIVHNLLIYFYEIRKSYKRQQTEITVPRFTQGEMIQHALLLTSFLILAITGFALKYHQSWWAEMLLSLGMTEPVRQWTHRISAIIMLAVGFYHVWYLLFTARGRDVLKNMLPKLQDAKDVVDNLMYYLRLSKKHPTFHKFDYTEKAEYWALIWGTIVMGVTGFILWFPTIVGDWAPVWLIKVSEIIHFYEAILATLAIIVWHWFFVIFRPSEYPMNFAWISGGVTLAKYKEHHKVHYKEVFAQLKDFTEGKIQESELKNFAKLFKKRLTDNKIDLNEFVKSELEYDLELREWIEKKDLDENK